jgi:GST-like protein
MASFPWVRPYERQGQSLEDFPHLKAWFERMQARPAVKRGLALAKEMQGKINLKTDKAAQRIMFGQRAR